MKGLSPGKGQLEPYSVKTVVWKLLGSTRQLPITSSLRPNSSFSSQNSTMRIMHACVFTILLSKGLGTRQEEEGRKGQEMEEEEKEVEAANARVIVTVNQPGGAPGCLHVKSCRQ